MLKFKDKGSSVFISYKNAVKHKPVFLTGLIMVKNQEKSVLDSICSLNKICDHIIVVDTGSTDRTVENIKSNFPKVEIHTAAWKENYAYMRNLTLKFISKGWVSVLDSDETIESNITYNEIHNFLSDLQNQTDDQKDIICSTVCRSEGISAFVRRKNLFKYSPTLRYHGLVHEELISTNYHDMIIVDTDISAVNKGTNSEEVRKFDKSNRYSKLLAEQIKLEPNNPRWTAMLSVKYVVQDENRLSFYKSKLQKFIFINKPDDFSINNIRKNEYLKYNLYRYLLILNFEEKITLAIDGCKIARKLYPYDANFLSLYLSLRNELNDIENYQSLNELTNSLHMYKKNIDKVHEESQGSEDILDELLVTLLIKLRHYDIAKDVMTEIERPIYRENLSKEIDLFGL